MKTSAKNVDDWLGTKDNQHLGNDDETVANSIKQGGGLQPNKHLRKHVNQLEDGSGARLNWGRHIEYNPEEGDPSLDSEDLADHLSWEGYTGSKEVNNALISHAKTGEPIHPDIHKKITGIDAAMSKARLPADLHTYSGTSFNPGELASKSKGRVLTMPAYASTSHNKQLAYHYSSRGGAKKADSKHIIHFHMKKGDAAAGVSDLTDAEHENTIHRGQRFKIDEKPDVYDDASEGHPQKLHVWHAHPVDKKPYAPKPLAVGTEKAHRAWFDKLGKPAQQDYIKRHPNSIYAKGAK